MDGDPKRRRRVGEGLILLLERMSDFEKPRLLSLVFRSFLLGEINESEYEMLAEAVDQINHNLLESFALSSSCILCNSDGFLLLNWGLVEVDFGIEEIRMDSPSGKAIPKFAKSKLGMKFGDILRSQET